MISLSLCMIVKNEEAVLEKGLAGYAAYQQRVRYKMLPYIW